MSRTDWIPVSLDLPTKEEVVFVAQKLGRSCDEVVGWLIRLWAWYSRESADGHVRLDLRGIAIAVGVPIEFLQALVQVQWLQEDSSGTSVVNWDHWLSHSAKARCRAALRQRIHRAAAAGDSNVARRADVTAPQTSRPAARAAELDWQAISFPPECDTPEIRTAITEWLEYRRRLAKPYKLPEKQISVLLERYREHFPAAVRYSIAQGYQGCFAPTGGSDGRTPKDNPNRYTYDPNRKLEPL